MSSQPHLQAVSGAWTTSTDGDVTPPPASTSDGDRGGDSKNRRAQKARPDRNLPTDRVRFDRQTQLLKFAAQMSGPMKRALTSEDLSTAIGLKGGTGGLVMGFFADSGWVAKAGRGQYAATDALLEYWRTSQFRPDSAKEHLRSTFVQSWYWEELRHLLSSEPIPIASLLLQLSRVANAHDHHVQLRLVLEWMEWLDLIRIDGEAVVLADEQEVAAIPSSSQAEEGAEVEAPPSATDSDASPTEVDHQEAAPPRQEQASDNNRGNSSSSLISLTLSVNVTAEDVAKLAPEQFEALMKLVSSYHA